MNEPQRLTQAKQQLENIVGANGAFQFMVKFNTNYERKHGSALMHCYKNMGDKNALDNYINREQAVKARYYEMVAHRYDRQMRLL